MPPKKSGGSKGDDKSEFRARLSAQLTIAFGLKNKNKSSKVQKFVQQVNKQQAEAGKSKADVSDAGVDGWRRTADKLPGCQG